MRLVAAALLGSLAACATVDRVTETTTQNAAKAAVRQVAQDRAPGVNVEPLTDCVIDNATSGEILALASTAVTGVTQSTVSTVAEITGRKRTVLCLSKAGLSQLSLT